MAMESSAHPDSGSILFQHLEKGVDYDSSSSYTRDGTVDWHGKPALKSKNGGWRCGLLVFLNLGLLTLSIAGVSMSMALFEKSVLRQTNARAADTFSNWIGTCYLFSLFGALLSDSPLGCFYTVIVSEIFLIVRVIILALITQFLLLKPKGCGTLASPCKPPTPFQLAIYYISIYIIAFGSGAADPELAALEADQFDEENPDEKHSKTSFYSYFYVALSLGCLAAETGLACVYSFGHCVLGFWLCTLAAVGAYLLLLCGSFRYRHSKPASGNPVSRFSQVIVASVLKMKLEVPVNNEQGLYYQPLNERGDTGNRRILGTNGFRAVFLL